MKHEERKMTGPEEVLSFWLDEVGPKGWYDASEALDQKIRDKFLTTWEGACEGKFSLWLTYPSGALAYLILTDQFPRNMFRDTGKAFASDRAALAVSKQCIERGVVDYAREAGVTADLAFSLQAWANVNMPGDYHNLHNHPHSWLSGTYYVQVPKGGDAGHRTDLNPNAISFFDPRAQANMTAIAGDGQFDPEHRVDPKAGQLLIWPAFLHHLVHPNLSEGPRVSISFNVVLKWRDEYLKA